MNGIEDSVEGAHGALIAGEEVALYGVVPGLAQVRLGGYLSEENAVADACRDALDERGVRPAGYGSVAPRAGVRVDEEARRVGIQVEHATHHVRFEIPHGVQVRVVQLLFAIQPMLRSLVVAHVRVVALGLQLVQHVPHALVHDECGQCGGAHVFVASQRLRIDEHDERRAHTRQHVSHPPVVPLVCVLALAERKVHRHNCCCARTTIMWRRRRVITAVDCHYLFDARFFDQHLLRR